MPSYAQTAAARSPSEDSGEDSTDAPELGTRPGQVGVAVLDIDPLTREGLKAVIAAEANLRLLHDGAHLRSFLATASHARPEIVFVEAGLASEGAGAAIRAVCGALPHARVIAFGLGNREEEVHQVLQAGASGYVVRTAIGRDLPRAVRRALAGLRYLPPEVERCLERRQRRPALTAREGTVLVLLAQARSNAAIAHLLGISVGTVKLHVRAVLAKLGVEDRAQAALAALERGFARID